MSGWILAVLVMFGVGDGYETNLNYYEFATEDDCKAAMVRTDLDLLDMVGDDVLDPPVVSYTVSCLPADEYRVEDSVIMPRD